MFRDVPECSMFRVLLTPGRNIAEESEHVSIFSHEKNREQDKNWFEKNFQFGIIMFFSLNDTLIIFFLC